MCIRDSGIPYWDFDAPVEEQTYRDASAAAIMASAFIELSRYIPGTDAKESYLAIIKLWRNYTRATGYKRCV